MDKEQVVDYAVENSNVERSVVEAAMSGLTQMISQLVLNGHNITVDGLGCFFLTNSSKGSEKEADVTADNVKKAYVRFRPCSRLKKDLAQVHLFDVTNIKYGDVETETPTKP